MVKKGCTRLRMLSQKPLILSLGCHTNSNRGAIPVQKRVRLPRQCVDVAAPPRRTLQAGFAYEVGGEKRPVRHRVPLHHIPHLTVAPFLHTARAQERQ